EPTPVVFEYSNQSKPMMIERKDGSRSPTDRKRRRRSPSLPSAYSSDRRSPSRPSPAVWAGRPGAWSGARDRTPPWQRQSRDRTIPGRRSRSRSPHRKDKKKKHKRSKSKSPSRKDRHKDKSRHSHSQDKSKHRPKDRDKKKEKKKSRHRSKERETKHSRSKYSDKVTPEGLVENSGDTINNPLDVDQLFFSAGKSGQKPGSISNSPAIHTSSISISRGSTPSRTLAESASADLMSKVRAMLKKSREMILKEERSLLDDT
ncbi:unnamed protein product, partial [Candidula unifasciata]